MLFEGFFIFVVGSILLILIAPTIEAKVLRKKYALIRREAVRRGDRPAPPDADS